VQHFRERDGSRHGSNKRKLSKYRGRTTHAIITRDGKMIRIEAGEIRQAGRSTQGVKLVNVEAGDQVAAASLIPDTETNGGQEDLPLQ
jgi:DNA gyrase/topoisomerase IV subunit A